LATRFEQATGADDQPQDEAQQQVQQQQQQQQQQVSDEQQSKQQLNKQQGKQQQATAESTAGKQQAAAAAAGVGELMMWLVQPGNKQHHVRMMLECLKELGAMDLPARILVSKQVQPC